MREKVLMIVSNGFDPDPRVYKEASTLVENGYEVEILCWDRENNYLDKETEILRGIKIKRLYPYAQYSTGLKQIKAYIKFFLQAKKYIKNKSYDVIHTHDFECAIIGALLKKERKLIWDMHEFYDGFNYSRLRSLLYKIMAKFCFKRADGIIYVVPEQKNRYEKEVLFNTKTKVVMNCPEEEVFQGLENISSNKLRISFIGNVRDYNSLKLLMEVGEKFSNVLININGYGSAYEGLKEIEKQYKNTVITGRFNYMEIKKYYENTDVIFAVYNSDLPNTMYAFPVKGAEAIICGKPIIANTRSFFGDFVKEQDIGFVISDKSENELYSVIKSIVDNEEILEKKKENIKKIGVRFLWSNEVLKLIELYDEVLRDNYEYKE
ncbi:glycosyltransferase [Clostridium culturomicium]|uniref:glycosyltransferase n=1 Tax=Clostridium culturomicium TaxID=1499683 RepID=UPI00385722DE